MNPIEESIEQLSLTELVRLQDLLSRGIVRRFERRRALVFSDVVGSTPYFARFGDEAGRQLQQRHVDLINAAIAAQGGRVVDTAGDGAFMCFDNVDAAVHAMVDLQRAIAADNMPRPPDHRLQVRIGVHAGPVLVDGALVTGESVNFCSRVAGSAGAGELRLSHAAYAELTDPQFRLRARLEGEVVLKGVEKPQDLYVLDWLDSTRFPTLVRFEDGVVVRLPALELIRFGRLREHNGVAANDVVIAPLDPVLHGCISRWHFELHRRADGFALRAVSATSSTEIDGKPVTRGDYVPVRPGTKVRLGGVFNLDLVSEHFQDDTTRLLK